MDRLQPARTLYLRGQMHDALEAAQAACEKHPRDAEAWRLLACVSRFTGLPAASDDAFRRAAQLSRRHPPPHRVDARAFQAMVDQQLAALSPDARRRLAHAEVRVAELPAVESIQAGQVDPDALTARTRGEQDVLTLFKVNHENRSASEADLRKLVGRALTRA